jgi:hypothetical protein
VVRRLRDENARLRGLLIERSIRIPEIPSTSGVPQPPQTISTAPDVRRSAVRTAEQRIELFRSLFRGRDDVYAIRWESSDGRSGYMPKADRDWKSYLRAKDKDRKKVDRQTRKFRPLTLSGIIQSESTRFCRTRPAGSWRSISIKRPGRRMPPCSARLVARWTCQRFWNVLGREMAAMFGYSSIKRFLRSLRENLAAQSLLELWSSGTKWVRSHMTGSSPTRTRCPREVLAT